MRRCKRARSPSSGTLESLCFITLAWHYGCNAYQDGGYWYYMSLGIAVTLWHKHPAEAREWVANTYTDITTGNNSQP
jgi:hypothetical protein